MTSFSRLEARRILVFRALKLGDMLCAVPALRALRCASPRAEIVLVGLPWARAFADRYRRLLNGFREFPGDPALPERVPDLEGLPRFYEAIRGERFDLAIQMHGSGAISNGVAARFGARWNAGHYPLGGDCPDAALYMPYPNRGLETHRLLGLMEHLGIASRGEALEFPLFEEDVWTARALLADRSNGARAAGAPRWGPGGAGHVCVHGGASEPARRWPRERFAAVADSLAGRGHAVVLTGTADEAELVCSIARAMRAPSINLAGQTPLGPLAALIADARLLVCNDTGTSHLADALGTPSVVISTGENPERWAPADHLLHRVLCRGPNTGVTVGEAVTEADSLLRLVPRRPRARPVRAQEGGPWQVSGPRPTRREERRPE